MITAAQAILGFILLLRLFELWLARRNTEQLLAAGGIEHGAEHYPYMVMLHGAWLGALALTTRPETAVDPFWLGLFVLLQLARAWVIASLGRFWTTRIITLPGAPVIRHGPYRWLRHPNYAVVIGEIAVVPMIFGSWWIALVFSALNLLLLRERIRVEDAALAPRRDVEVE